MPTKRKDDEDDEAPELTDAERLDRLELAVTQLALGNAAGAQDTLDAHL